MAPLFPQYDQQELEQTVPHKKKSESARQATPMKTLTKSSKSQKLDTKTQPAPQTQQLKMAQPKIKTPETPKTKLKVTPKDKVSTTKLAEPEILVATEPTSTVFTIPLAPPAPVEITKQELAAKELAAKELAAKELAQIPGKPVGLREETKPQPEPVKENQGKRPLFDIPEDALPPPRPEPILALRPSVPLHAKLIAQARDEGISVESLALEMLAESVVLRAWEIVERKNAMRGHNQGQPPHQRNPNYRPPRSGNYGDGSFNNSASGHSNGHPSGHHNGHYNNQHSGHGQPRDQRGGYRRPHQGWKDDQSQFLEYVRNQEKRNRRSP